MCTIRTVRITKSYSFSPLFVCIYARNNSFQFFSWNRHLQTRRSTIKNRAWAKFNISFTDKLVRKNGYATLLLHVFLERTYTHLQTCPPSNALITSNYPVLHLHAYDHPDRANTQPSRNKLHLITRALIACPHSAGLCLPPLRRPFESAYIARGGSSGSRYLFPRGRKRNGRPQGGIDPSPFLPPPRVLGCSSINPASKTMQHTVPHRRRRRRRRWETPFPWLSWMPAELLMS